MNRTLWSGVLVAVLAGILSAGSASAEEEVWKKRREIQDVFWTVRKLNEAIQRYAMSADRLPAKGADLPEIYHRAFYPEKFPELPLAWHGKNVTVQAYAGDPAKVVEIRQGDRREATFVLNLDNALKDTGQIMYAAGEATLGEGPKHPYAVVWFDCTHDKGEFDVRMCAGGVVKTSFGRPGRSRWLSIMEAERFQVENQEPTPGHINAVRSAISIFYGDWEGFYPPSLDHLNPLYMEAIPGRRHLAYDLLTGEVGVRARKEGGGDRR